MKKWYTPVFIQLVTPGPYRNKRIVTILIWPPDTGPWLHGYNEIGRVPGYGRKFRVLDGYKQWEPRLPTRRVPVWWPMRVLPAHSLPPLCSTSLSPRVGLTLFLAAIYCTHWCKHCKNSVGLHRLEKKLVKQAQIYSIVDRK